MRCMNITNKDYFTFAVDNSLLLVGQSGSGKTELVKTLLRRYEAALSPKQLRYALFDMKAVEFAQAGSDYKPEFLYCDVITDPTIGLGKLDELATLSQERATSGSAHPMLFIYIEECDMAAIDQARFDGAVITINNNAKKATMKLIYSTSRPSSDVISQALVASFDLIMTGSLASEADAKHLGVPHRSIVEKYSFLVTQHDDIYDAAGKHYEMVDLSTIEGGLGGENEPPRDDRLLALLQKAYKGELDCHKAIVPMGLIVPFSDYQPTIDEGFSSRFNEAYRAQTPPDVLVYQKGDKFIMSDDYTTFYMYKNINAPIVLCTVLGESTITDGVEYGPPFKLQLPTLEMNG